MRKRTFAARAAARGLLAAVFAALAGCGARAQETQLGAPGAPFSSLLPAVAQLTADAAGAPRAISVVQNATLAGADYFAASGGATVAGAALELASAAAGIEWAIYRFPTAGHPLLEMYLTFTGSGTSTWLGLANFAQGSWEFPGIYPISAPNIDISSPDYVSPGDDFFFVVVTFNGTSSTIASATITYDQPQATFGISGTVREDGIAPLAGVELTLLPGGATVLTGAGGAYSFSGLASGMYTVTPALAGYDFTPAAQNVSVLNADESGVDFSATAQPPTVTYTADIKPLLDANCVSCHNPSSPVGRPRLHNYENASMNAAAALTMINANAMPPFNPLSDEQKALFSAWVDAGTPE